MPFDINKFQQNIAEYDIILSDKFDLTITLPPILQTLSSQTNNSYGYLSQWNEVNPMRAVSCSTPGVAMMEHETNKFGVGPRIKQAYNAVFVPIRVSFLADAKNIIEDTLTLWLNSRFQYSFDSGSLSTFMSNYRSDTVSPSIIINKYDRHGNKTKTYNITGATPTILSSQKLDWGMRNSLNILNTTFDYVSYTSS